MNDKKLREYFNNDEKLIEIVKTSCDLKNKNCSDGEINNYIMSSFDNYLTILKHYHIEKGDTWVEEYPRFKKDLEKVYNNDFSKDIQKDEEMER